MLLKNNISEFFWQGVVVSSHVTGITGILHNKNNTVLWNEKYHYLWWEEYIYFIYLVFLAASCSLTINLRHFFWCQSHSCGRKGSFISETNEWWPAGKVKTLHYNDGNMSSIWLKCCAKVTHASIHMPQLNFSLIPLPPL